jgi:putative acetyltransferase
MSGVLALGAWTGTRLAGSVRGRVDGDRMEVARFSVAPDLQGQGIGTALIEDGLARLRALGSAGCVLTGSGYYQRFGFRNSERMRVEGYPATDFLVLPFGEVAEGVVAFHPVFE